MIRFTIDEIKYVIPEKMTINNYVKLFKVKDLFEEQYFAAKLLNIVTEAPLKDLLDCDYDKINFLASKILQTIPKQDSIKFIDRFEIDGIKYGFFPNWKDLTFAEFVDLDTISTKKPDEILDFLHILSAIMYRPIINERSEHDYDIEPYDIESMKKRAEIFKKELDVKYVFGAQFFFIKFADKYLNYSPQYLTQKIGMMKMLKMIWTFWRTRYKMGSVKSLGGFWSSTKYLTMTLQNMNTSTKKIS